MIVLFYYPTLTHLGEPMQHAINAMILENHISIQDDSVRVEYRRLCLLLGKWQEEKETNRHHMARYADRVMTGIHYRLSFAVSILKH